MLNKILNKFLDASIFFSFDRSGFLRHKKSFHKDLKYNLQSNILITGGTSGIGFACAQFMKDSGQVFVTGRDKSKGKEAQKNGATFLQLDMGQWDKIDDFCDNLPKLSALVLNAGGMPDKKILNSYDVESQAASQLFGHYYLLKALYNKNKLIKNAKIIWVSSGGMYLKNLDIKELIDPTPYEKIGVYANVKRAQVTLLDILAKTYPDLLIYGMHPGWVATKAVKHAIPGFYQRMDKRLRRPSQGADTINWLLSDEVTGHSGKFYFDRKVVSKHLMFFTRKSAKLGQDLLDLLNKGV